MTRLQGWAKRGFVDHLVIALQGESVLRFLSGLLTIFLAFYIETTAHGLEAALQLGAVVGRGGPGHVQRHRRRHQAEAAPARHRHHRLRRHRRVSAACSWRCCSTSGSRSPACTSARSPTRCPRSRWTRSSSATSSRRCAPAPSPAPRRSCSWRGWWARRSVCCCRRTTAVRSASGWPASSSRAVAAVVVLRYRVINQLGRPRDVQVPQPGGLAKRDPSTPEKA